VPSANSVGACTPPPFAGSGRHWSRPPIMLWTPPSISGRAMSYPCIRRPS